MNRCQLPGRASALALRGSPSFHHEPASGPPRPARWPSLTLSSGPLSPGRAPRGRLCPPTPAPGFAARLLAELCRCVGGRARASQNYICSLQPRRDDCHSTLDTS